MAPAGAAKQQQIYVPAKGQPSAKQAPAILQQAATDPNLELWLLQIPAGVNTQSLSGVELAVPTGASLAASVGLAGSTYQLREEAPASSIAAGSQVVVVLPGAASDSGHVAVPVRRRMVLARVHRGGTAEEKEEEEGPQGGALQAQLAPHAAKPPLPHKRAREEVDAGAGMEATKKGKSGEGERSGKKEKSDTGEKKKDKKERKEKRKDGEGS